MSLDEARLLAGVWERARWLFEAGYQAKVIRSVTDSVTDTEAKKEWMEASVASPQGEEYLVSLPEAALKLLRASESCRCDNLPPECGKELLCLLTGGQEGCNHEQIGRCTCPFWRIHAGRYWCKHYLGVPLLLARQREERMRTGMLRAAGVVSALRSVGTERIRPVR